MLVFFNWNVRIRNSFLFFAILWCYFLDSSWIQFSSWFIFFGACVVTADLDEDRIGDTFEDFYEDILGNYTDITKKEFNLGEDTWLVKEQLKHHLNENPRDIDELLAYREKQAKDEIIKEHRKKHSYENLIKHTKKAKWYTERDDILQYTSEGIEARQWVLEIVSEWWYGDEHLVMPNAESNDYRLLEILSIRQNEKIDYKQAYTELREEQINSYFIHNQRKVRPYKNLWIDPEFDLVCVRDEPVFWPRSDDRQPKATRSWNLAVKRIKKNRFKLLKDSIGATLMEVPSNEQLHNCIIERFGNSLCFQPDLAIGKVGKKLRSLIYKKSDLPKKLNWRLINQEIENKLKKQEADWRFDKDIIRAGILSGDDHIPRKRPKGWKAKPIAREKLQANSSTKSKGY